MFGSRGPWIALMAALSLLYIAGLALALTGHGDHVLARGALIVLVVHVLELPLAFAALKGRNARVGRVLPATLLFGALWWLPARRGVFAP